MTLEIAAGQERLELWLSSVAAYHVKRREENIEAWGAPTTVSKPNA